MKFQNRKVRLLPGNKRLKQLITAFGEIWILGVYKKSVQCLSGSGYFIMSRDETHERWVEEEFIEELTERSKND